MSIVNKIFLFVAILAFFYAFICVCYFFLQKNMIHFPRVNYAATPENYNFRFEEVSLVHSDQSDTISGWFFPNSNSQFTILMFSGNAGNMSYLLDTVEIFLENGFSVMTYDYRSFGKSTGILTEENQYADTELVWNYLTESRNINPQSIILLGRSLGTAMATWLAIRQNPGALILESGFTSIYDMAKHYYKWLPVKLLLRWKYDNLSRIAQVKCPILFIHSKEDELIPYQQSEKMFEQANHPKQFLTIQGNHMEGFLLSEETYVSGVRRFVDLHLKQRNKLNKNS